MLKILFFILNLATVHANSFSLNNTGSRFSLSISKDKLTYVSESIRKSIDVKKCNLGLVKKINSDLLGVIPQESGKFGLEFKLDNKKISVDPKSTYGKRVLAMDFRMTDFFMMERKACHY